MNTVNPLSSAVSGNDGLAFDEIVERALTLSKSLPDTERYHHARLQMADLSERLAGGRLYIAVLGQFNRGKSSFLNAFLGLPVLPVSVLPITTIPTVIIYGTSTTCSIEFSGQKPPIKISDSLKDITDALRIYVAEDRNPRNIHGVSRVIITCNSPLLRHGTTLIDTPGFGSTHEHNTETTRRLVEGCDAALFLLSADLPITQVEVDFLKLVQEYVPRIFFLYNKIDLLSPEELETTSEYIRDTLGRSLRFPVKPVLFPMSVRLANQAVLREAGNPEWDQSGMEHIKTEIVDFLFREKYFALSQALNEKLSIALGEILTALTHERESLQSPIDRLNASCEQAIAYIKKIRECMESEISVCRQDEMELCRRFEQHLMSIKDSFNPYIEDTIETHLSATVARPGSDRTVFVSVKQIFGEQLAYVYISIVSSLNNVLIEMMAGHRIKIEHVSAVITEYLCDNSLETDKSASLPSILIDTSAPWRPSVKIELPATASHLRLLDAVSSSQMRFRRYKEMLASQFNEYSNICIQEMSDTIKSRIRSAIESLSESIQQQYRQQLSRVEQRLSEHKATLDERNKYTSGDIDKIDILAREFTGLKSSLA